MPLLFVFHSFSDLANSNPVQVCVGLYEKLHSLWCMAALCNTTGHYIFALWFLSFFFFLSIFFPRLISAAGEWMSTIFPHMVWP